MKAKERLQFISNEIETHGRCSVAELSVSCQVTEETIRRDLDRLESQGFITRTHGGAVWNTEPQKEGIHFYRRQAMNVGAKRKIAQQTGEILSELRTVMADSSSTVLMALKTLPETSALTVVTNSSEIFHEIQTANFQLISTGGVFNSRSQSFQGEICKETISRFYCDAALISCKGIDLEQGVLDSYESEADIKRAMLRRSDRVILLADHTKFGKKAFLKLIDLQQLDCIITDVRPREEWITFCRENGIRLIYP